MMRTNIFFFCIFLFLSYNSYAQKIIRKDNVVIIKGDTTLFFDAEGRPITSEAHSDSLETGKYIISIKGTDEKPEIHLTYKHPDLKTLIGKNIGEREWEDLEGKTVRIGDKPGYTVISFWNKHCRVCIRELTALDVLVEDFPDIRIVALAPDSPDEIRKLMKRLKLNWENITVVPDDDGELTQELQLFVYPSTVVIDRNKEIRGVTVGGNTRELLKTLEQLCSDTDACP